MEGNGLTRRSEKFTMNHALAPAMSARLVWESAEAKGVLEEVQSMPLESGGKVFNSWSSTLREQDNV